MKRKIIVSLCISTFLCLFNPGDSILATTTLVKSTTEDTAKLSGDSVSESQYEELIIDLLYDHILSAYQSKHPETSEMQLNDIEIKSIQIMPYHEERVTIEFKPSKQTQRVDTVTFEIEELTPLTVKLLEYKCSGDF